MWRRPRRRCSRTNAEPGHLGVGVAGRDALTLSAMSSRALIAVAVIAAFVVAAAVWFLGGTPPPPPLAPAPIAVAANSPPALVAEPPPSTGRVPRPLDGATQPPPMPTPITEADRKIDEILRANPDNSEASNLATAQALLNLLPTLPPDGQAEAAQHIANLLPDKEYNRVQPIVKNAATPEPVLDVFVTDLMNRDDSVKLPTLLEIAKIPNHPNREEAMTDLQIFLDGDFGTDWAKWDVSLKAYLKKQAEQSAAVIGK